MGNERDPNEPLLGPRALARFTCLAERCPDNCCRAWTVGYDEGHFVELERVLLANPAEHERYHRAFRPDPDGKHHRLIVLRDNDDCAFLAPTGHCEIQAGHGEALLSNTCAMYPRFVVDVAGEPEIGARLSCPELARLALLADADDGMTLGPIPPAHAGRAVVSARLERSLDAKGFLSTLRRAFVTLLDRDAPLRSRLFYLGYLATRFDALDASFTTTEDALRRERAQLDAPAVQRALDRALSDALGKTASLAPHLLTVLLSGRMQRPSQRAFDRLVAAALTLELTTARAEGDEPAPQDFLQLGATRLERQHTARVAALTPDQLATMDRALANVARHAIQYDYFRSDTLLRWFLDLTLRMALMRYLIVAQLAAGAPVERAIVDVVYSQVRAFDHNRALVEAVANALLHSKITALAHGVSVLKLA